MAISDKLTYLNETKTLLKNKINITGANIINDTFRQYPTKLQNALLECWNNEGEPIFTNWGNKINGEGTNVKLDNTINARMKLTPKGNTTQNGTPTPSSPINVNVVSGDNEVVVCGKNLFDKNNVRNNYRLDPSGNQNYDENCALSDYISIQPSTDYTRNITASVYECICFYTIDKTFISRNTTQATTTSSNNAYYARISCYKTNLDTLQLEKGSTATTYEPYTSQSYPLYLGVENLLDLKNGTYTNSGVTAVVTNGQVLLNGTPTSGSSFITIQLNKNINWVNGKDHTIMINNNTSIGTENTYGAIRIDLNGTLDTKFNIANNYKVVNIDVSSVFNDRIQIRTGYGITYNNYVIEPKIIVASKPNYITDTPIELCKIGNYVDFPFKAINGDKYYDSLTQAQKDLLTYGKWYLHKEIGKVVLNGSESWSKSTTSDSNYRYYIENFLYAIADLGACSHYALGVFSQRNATGQSGKFFIGGTNSLQFVNDISTVADFKTWLGTNQPIVYYVLSTPTNTEITDTTLIGQLEDLKGAMSYEGQTNIDSGFMIVGASALGELE